MKLDPKALGKALTAFKRKAPRYWLEVRDADMHVAKANESAITAYLTAIGETHVLVPKEPSDDMLKAGLMITRDDGHGHCHDAVGGAVYRAMLGRGVAG